MPNTPNLAMPLLFAAQAQKEITHNEALVLIDALLIGCAQAEESDPAAIDPAVGNLWIVASDPVGIWTGRAAHLAIYTDGGWRFVPPVSGMRILDLEAGVLRRCDGSGWLSPSAIADPAGGATVDAEARSAIAALLAVLRTAGMLAAS